MEPFQVWCPKERTMKSLNLLATKHWVWHTCTSALAACMWHVCVSALAAWMWHACVSPPPSAPSNPPSMHHQWHRQVHHQVHQQIYPCAMPVTFPGFPTHAITFLSKGTPAFCNVQCLPLSPETARACGPCIWTSRYHVALAACGTDTATASQVRTGSDVISIHTED